MYHRSFPATWLALVASLLAAPVFGAPPLPTAEGYRGIWYDMGKKYSGGMATYPQQIRPLAIYAAKVDKTFFVYGGTNEAGTTLLHMVSYFDHATGTVPRPRILLDKQTKDAHDNPCIAIDDAGHLWIFSNTHGPRPRSSIHRSTEPYSINAFEPVVEKASFSYGQPWHVPGRGFLFVHNRYENGRAVAFMTSEDGRRWSEPALLAQMAKGHYQISARHGECVAVAFNYHPKGLDSRTNLYYLESSDFGQSWRTAAGEVVELPLKDPKHSALVDDAEARGLLVYLKDVQFDAQGRPVLLYLTSKGHMPGAENGPHQWMLARWTGEQWRTTPITTSDHNYDYGQLDREPNGLWRLIAPTDPGPQPWMTGGEVVMWTSGDDAATWTRAATVTADSPRNHTYVRRPVDGRDDFYALWADGNAAQRSESFLYFTDRTGQRVWQLPKQMTQDYEKPRIWDGR